MPQEGRKPGWPQGSRKLGRARDRSSFYLEVYRLDIIPSGIMAQTEQKTLYFDCTSEAEEQGYIDLSSALTAANRKQYHQVSTSGNPLCYRVMVTAVKGDWTFEHLNNSFLIGNAVKQTVKGWKAQLRHGGVKLKDLPPYGRRPRFALNRFQQTVNNRTDSGVNDDVWQISAINLKPLTSPGGSSWFATYEATDGVSIGYRSVAAPDKDNVCANQISMVTITDGAGAESNVPLTMSGNTAGEFNVIREYLKGRRQSPDLAIDAPGISEDSQMLNLFSIAEEMSDDIVDAVDGTHDYKPYTPDDHTNVFDEFVQGAQINSATTADTQYPMVSAVMDVPLGMLKIEAVDGTNLQVDVLSIYEM